MSSLRQVIEGGPRYRADPLKTAWCWPADPMLATRAASRFALTTPSPPRVREVVLLGVLNKTHGALYRLCDSRDENAIPAASDTGNAWNMAWDCALEHAPLVLDPKQTCGKPSFACIARQTTAQHVPGAISLAGRSYGLSFCLSHASRLLGQVVPPSIAASATVNSDGTLGTVEGHEAKAWAVHQLALGVKTLLVARGDLATFKRLLEGTGTSVVPLDTVSEAFAEVWPQFQTKTEAHWNHHPDDAARAAHALEATLIVSSPHLSRWHGVVRTADALVASMGPIADLPASSGRAYRSAQVARKIAMRHLGHDDGRIPWPTPDDLPERHDLRMRYLAHVVQSWSDGDSPERAGEAAERALACLRPPLDRGVADLILAGAIGRALGSSGEEAKALTWLLDVINDWNDIGLPEQSSFALCEGIRLAGVLGRYDVLEKLHPHIDWWMDAHRMDAGGTFVRVERVRAFVLLDRATDALALAADPEWPTVNNTPWVEAARVRWLANALDKLGKNAEARTTRVGVPDVDAAKALVRLDQCLVDGVDASEALDKWPDKQQAERNRTRTIARLRGVDEATYVARHYRY